MHGGAPSCIKIMFLIPLWSLATVELQNPLTLAGNPHSPVMGTDRPPNSLFYRTKMAQ